MLRKISLISLLSLTISLSKANPIFAKLAPIKSSVNLTDLGLALTAADQPLDSGKMFAESLAIAQTISDQNTKILTLANIAIKLAQSGSKNQALTLFDQADKLAKEINNDFTIYQQEIVQRDLVIALAKAGFWDVANQRLKKILSTFRKAEALNEIAIIQVANGQNSQAKKTLLEALQNARGITGDYIYESNGSCANYKFEILGKIAKNLSILSQLDQALPIAEEISGCSSANGESGEDYQSDAFLGILTKVNQPAQISKIWQSVQKMKNPVEQAPVWSEIAQKFISVGDLKSAQIVTKKIVTNIPWILEIDSGASFTQLGIKEKALYDIAVKLAESKQFDSAIDVAKMIRIPTEKQLQNYQQYSAIQQPNQALTLSKIAVELGKNNQIDRALEITKNLTDPQAKVLALIGLLPKMPKNSIETINIEIKKLLPEVTANNINNIENIALAFVNSWQIQKGLEFAKSIPEEFEQTLALTTISQRLVKVGKIDQAWQIVKMIKNQGYITENLIIIAEEMIKLDKINEAQEIVQKLEPAYRDHLLVKIINRLIQQKKMAQALKLAQNINLPELKAQSIAAIAANLKTN